MTAKRLNYALIFSCSLVITSWLSGSLSGQDSAGDNVSAVNTAVGGQADSEATEPEANSSGEAKQATTGDIDPPQEMNSQDAIRISLLVIGIVAVLGMIIGLKLNAFLALIISALIVSLGVGFLLDDPPALAGARMGAVVTAFGKAAGSIGIVIAMAAVIGKCMLDSGSADRIVRSAVRVTGEKMASLGLMASGFVLAIPVFFDTVFYLLVPLARSLHQRTGKHYLRYLMAIATGGAITHTLVPPTPGPLLVAAILGVDIGMMMLIGTMVAIPAAAVGLVYSVVVDFKMPVEMRPLGVSRSQREALTEEKMPSLWISLLPVALPVVLILAGTVSTTLADAEDKARLRADEVRDYDQLAMLLSDPDPISPAGRLMGSQRNSAEDRLRLRQPATDEAARESVIVVLNDALLDVNLYQQEAFGNVKIPEVAKSKIAADKLRMKPVEIRRMNRVLLEASFPELIETHTWETPRRRLSDSLGLWSNPNFALLLAALVAMLTLKRVRSLSWRGLGEDVEESLMSGGVIILITAAGGAFGAMLTDTQISETIKASFQGSQTSGIGLLMLAFGIAAVLKVAQGSSTVAMIIGAGMMSAIIGDAKPEFNMVYVAAAVGSGSLMGSWMNDSGFWVFTKMGGLTEGESLRSWTPLLVVLSLVSLGMTVALSQFLPMRAEF